jgi:hypothetical protein
MLRLVDDLRQGGAVLISHTHNQLRWSISHGQTLPPDGYRDLFDTTPARVFAESRLFADVVGGGPLDLGRQDSDDSLADDPALVLLAAGRPDVFRAHPLSAADRPLGELRVNPLYVAEAAGDFVRLQLRFPTAHYEEEFGACRAYLPDTVLVRRDSLDALATGRVSADLAELVRRHVVLDLPRNYC